MGKIKVNARDMNIEVATPASLATGTPEWVEVDGLTNFVVNPSENEEMAETTTYKDEGNFRQEKMQKGAVIELEGFELADKVTGAQDPGQKACEDWHELLGPESEGLLRYRRKGATEWKNWQATCTVGEKGGEVNDKGTWSATFSRNGASWRTDEAGEVIDEDAPAPAPSGTGS